MVHQKPLLVTFVVLVDRIPMPAPPKKRGRGRPKVYPDRLIVKALIIMVVRRLYSAYSLLAFLEVTSPIKSYRAKSQKVVPVRSPQSVI